MAAPPEYWEGTNSNYSSLRKALDDAIAIQRSDLIIVFGGKLLKLFKPKVGYEALEQLLMSALEYRQVTIIQECISELHKKLSAHKSQRVKRLLGMARESAGNWTTAMDTYKEILNDTPEDVLTRKRVIALYKNQGKMVECVEHLNRHLEEFCTDTEAWHELAEIYMSESSLSRAAFCFEELLMHDPRNLYHIVTYAELQYSMGNVVLSRKYLCLALSLDEFNIRALWGLILVYSEPNTASPTSGRKRGMLSGGTAKKDLQSSTPELFSMALHRLHNSYSNTLKQPNREASVVATSVLRWIDQMKATYAEGNPKK